MVLDKISSSQSLVDKIFLITLIISIIIFFSVLFTIIYFLIRYNRKRNPVPEKTKENNLLEITWTTLTLILFLLLFFFGWKGFQFITSAPKDSFVIEVVAKQWSYSFIYPNGKVTAELLVPSKRPIKLEVRSSDVLHGFFIPALRLKVDAVPNKINTIWFEAEKEGEYPIECTVICGIQHAYMLSKLIVVGEEKFKKWYFGKEETLPLP